MSVWCGSAAGGRARGVALVIMLLVGAWNGSALAQDRFALIVSGVSGGEPYAERYDRWRAALVDALRGNLRFPDDHLYVLAETPGSGVGRASREGVRQAFAALRERMTDDALLFVVLIGHGTFDGVDAKFNLVGPDLEAREWRALVQPLPGQLILANTTAASFPFLERLAAERRIIITATDSAAQRYETRFAEFFASAFEPSTSDFDKDGRVSIWEAFTFASAAVRRWYEQQGRLSTERPILDDTGDGVGKEAGEPGLDGSLARRTFLEPHVEPVLDANPVLVELFERRERLEAEVEALTLGRDQMVPEAYARELERLLIELALVSREIRRQS